MLIIFLKRLKFIEFILLSYYKKETNIISYRVVFLKQIVEYESGFHFLVSLY